MRSSYTCDPIRIYPPGTCQALRIAADRLTARQFVPVTRYSYKKIHFRGLFYSRDPIRIRTGDLLDENQMS